MIIVVADAFANQMIGGAELTSEAFLEAGFNNYKRIQSQYLSPDIIEEYKDKKWIFFNFAFVGDESLLKIIKEIEDYHVVEYDYKYCKYRLKSKHESAEGSCDCETSNKGKLTAVFLARSKNLFFMSKAQKDEYENVFPILKKHRSSHVLSSSFTEDSIKHILNLDTSKKNNKYLILNSTSWVKGVKNCVEYAEKNNLEYELISHMRHHDLLTKMAKSKGLIFLPNGMDTCPRIVIEAKLLDCDVILNENVQHKDEPWFENKKSIIEYINKQKGLFYNKCLIQNLPYSNMGEQTKFHFIIPGYNVSDWLTNCVSSIIKQEYQNYSVVYVDDVSNDNTAALYEELTEDKPKFKLIKNEEKKYALKNISVAIESLKAAKDDVIIVLDADDWLSSPQVLNYLNSVYQEDSCWMTYGSYMYYPFGDRGVEPSEHSQDVVKNNSYREDKWRASHLRTFKKELWDKIDQNDLVDEDGEYYKMAYDQAMVLPMLEMAGNRAKYIPEILHVYNRANSINVDKIKQKQQYETMLRIRKREKYARVKK